MKPVSIFILRCYSNALYRANANPLVTSRSWF